MLTILTYQHLTQAPAGHSPVQLAVLPHRFAQRRESK
jgi:hypothetical protein